METCWADVVDLSETKIFVPLNSLSAQFLTESSEGPEETKVGAIGGTSGGFESNSLSTVVTKTPKGRRGLIMLGNKSPHFYQTGSKAQLTKVGYSTLAELASSIEPLEEGSPRKSKSGNSPKGNDNPGAERPFANGIMR